MAQSRGEIKIADVLNFAGIAFKREYAFNDLYGFTNHPLRFDFAVLDDNGELDFLIEYQGAQ